MSQDITQHRINTYKAGIEMLAQQTKCRLEPYVTVERDTGDRVSYDQIGAVAAQERTVRHADTYRVDTPHRRRWISNREFEVSDLLEPSDLVRVLNNPGGDYGRVFLGAVNRARDANIVAAMLGTTFTGVDGTTGVALPGTQQIAAGGTGFTLTKVQTAASRLMGQAVFDEGEELHIAWTKKQEDEFLGTNEVKSVDYNTQKVLVAGTMGDGTFYGFKYHRLEDWTDQLGNTVRIIPKVSTTRSCVAWVKSGVRHNLATPPNLAIEQRPYKSNNWQYLMKAMFGSCRMQDVKVVQIDVVES